MAVEVGGVDDAESLLAQRPIEQALDSRGVNEQWAHLGTDDKVAPRTIGEVFVEPRRLPRWRKLLAPLAVAGAIGGVMEAVPAGATNDISGYPDANAARVTAPGWYAQYSSNGTTIDSRGFYKRQCTAFAAWLEAKYGVKIPYGANLGNAGTWDDRAPRFGFAVDNAPRPGDVAVWDAKGVGHVAVVDSVDTRGTVAPNDDTVNTSDYNRAAYGAPGHQYGVRANHYIHFMSDAQRAKFMGVSTTPPPPPPTEYARVEAFGAADFNGDGFDDIFSSSKRDDPASNEQVWAGSSWLGVGKLWAAPPPEKITYSDSLNLMGDVDGDGKDDLVTLTGNRSDNAPMIWYQRSTGSNFEGPLSVGVPSLIARNTRWSMADVTGDGRADLIAFSKRGDVGTNLFVLRSIGNWIGGMEYWGATDDTVPFEGSTFLPGDKDGDGKVDLYAIGKHPNRTEPFVYWLKSNGQNFEYPRLTAIPGYPFDQIKFTAADLNGDHKTDLLASTKRDDTAPNFQAWLSDGSSSYTFMGLWSAPGDLRWADAQLIPADLNGDGYDDIVGVQKQAGGSTPEIWWVPNLHNRFDGPKLVGLPGVNFGEYRFQR